MFIWLKWVMEVFVENGACCCNEVKIHIVITKPIFLNVALTKCPPEVFLFFVLLVGFSFEDKWVRGGLVAKERFSL